METLINQACALGWVARLCRSWSSPGKANRISQGEIPMGQQSSSKKSLIPVTCRFLLKEVWNNTKIQGLQQQACREVNYNQPINYTILNQNINGRTLAVTCKSCAPSWTKYSPFPAHSSEKSERRMGWVTAWKINVWYIIACGEEMASLSVVLIDARGQMPRVRCLWSKWQFYYNMLILVHHTLAGTWWLA